MASELEGISAEEAAFGFVLGMRAIAEMLGCHDHLRAELDRLAGESEAGPGVIRVLALLKEGIPTSAAWQAAKARG